MSNDDLEDSTSKHDKTPAHGFEAAVVFTLMTQQAEIIWVLHRSKHSDESEEEFAARTAERAFDIVVDRFMMMVRSEVWKEQFAKMRPNVIDLIQRALLGTEPTT